MSFGQCQISECTIAATGVCLKNFEADQCPNRLDSDGVLATSNDIDAENGDLAVKVESATTGDLGGSVLSRPDEVPRLPSSKTLSLEGADSLRAARRATVVGVVGLPDSGKTACLVSLYLLAAKGLLAGFTCTNSETLMAFEEIARGSRRWNEGKIPEQMTVHTEMTDDREAGFLHLKLLRDADGTSFDLLVPDLPGEWSKALIDQNDARRFEFLKAVAVIWIMVDGRQFIDAVQVNYATYRTECLIERLAEMLPVPRPKLILVPSWRDRGEIPIAALTRLQLEGSKWGMHIETVSIASFSSTGVPPGTGVAALIEATLASTPKPVDFWPEGRDSSAARAMMASRREA